MECLKSISDMVDRDRQFWEITKGLQTPLVPGSLFRINELYLPAWGVEVTPAIRADLKLLSTKFNLKDELEVGTKSMDADLLLTTDSRADSEKQMAKLIGNIAATVASAMSLARERLAICDFGARNGKATVGTINEMRRAEDGTDLLDRTTFHLVESSAKRAGVLRAKLGLLAVDAEVHTDKGGSVIDCESILAELPNDSFDIIVTQSSLHHLAYTDYLINLNRVLRPGGMLVIGDSYSAAWQRPEYAVYLLEMLGLDKFRIEAFRKFFGIQDEKKISLRSDPTLQMFPDVLAICHQFEYWKEIQLKMERLQGDGRKPMRRYFLGGHTTLDQRMKDLGNAGFEVDMSEIRRAFPRMTQALPARMVPNSNFAVVTAAMKPERK